MAIDGHADTHKDIQTPGQTQGHIQTDTDRQVNTQTKRDRYTRTHTDVDTDTQTWTHEHRNTYKDKQGHTDTWIQHTETWTDTPTHRDMDRQTDSCGAKTHKAGQIATHDHSDTHKHGRTYGPTCQHSLRDTH